MLAIQLLNDVDYVDDLPYMTKKKPTPLLKESVM
jgi:hypothetical protein